jgi:hypothetical protein
MIVSAAPGSAARVNVSSKSAEVDGVPDERKVPLGVVDFGSAWVHA